ncbi:hypothetical protein LWC34_06555 [Kibdelosporangium philippinense]|uniref:Uncharacterized protein n=1 Tax=Kibdelosporangium philippinense TaxID=211113 RepID=A0ABS8Z4T8_9PSEU|nr:hypothetical protein [Kibdelosporangium philippinense]MCE7002492.1 hypothetical protein [Kibdelosporangium philippinense]
MNPDTVTEAFTETCATFTGLTAHQADGLACVVCGADYLVVRVAHRPVGRSVTGGQVFACAPACPPVTPGGADIGGATAGGDAL